ncbi:MAG: LuxR C-terminal-related transcriptional regulator [Eubacteriales bacterium]
MKTKTIEFHVGNILSKLGVDSRLEAVLRIKKVKVKDKNTIQKKGYLG